VTASEVEEVDFAPVLRAAQECPPGESAPVAERRRTMSERLGTLR
jgi:hypothetical protein